MKQELDEKLCAKYPMVFRDRNAPMTQTAMCWGFSHGDGWYNIIFTLCSLIQIHQKSQKSDYTPVVVQQVKEKFGGLRFYINSASDEVHKRISQAENLSYETCETCGEKGELRTNIGWHTTLCDTHYEKHKSNI